MSSASFGYMGLAVETTPGTAVAPTKFLQVKDVDFPVENEFIDLSFIQGSRQARFTGDGALRPSVSFSTSLFPAGAMGVVFKGLMGAVSTASAGASATAKVHTFADAGTLPSLTFERADARSAGGLLFQRLNGVKIESVSVSAAFGEDVNVEVSGQGLDFPVTPGSKPGSFTYPAMDPMIFSNAAIEIDGVANSLFKSIDMEFTNTLERQETLRGARTAYKIHEGGVEVSLSGTLAFDDLTLYNNLKNSTTFTVKAIFTGAVIDVTNSINYKTEFFFPKVKVSTFGIPMTAGEVMEADVEFNVAFDTATSKAFDIKMTNLDPSGSYDT